MFVLLLDSDQQNAETLTAVLRDEGHRPQWIADPAQFAGQHISNAPDVVLIGSDTLARAVLPVIRGLPGWGTVHVMVVNGEADPAATTQTIEAGADVYMPRPFRPAEFVARLRAIERRRALEHPDANQ